MNETCNKICIFFSAGDLLHLDKIEVFKKSVKQAKQENPDGFVSSGGTKLGIGLLLGYRCLLHGLESKCKNAEFLAIDDDDYLHKRLVRYYRSASFKVIKYVGDGIGDIPDRLIWGGRGTLMRQEMNVLLNKWTNMINPLS